MANGRPSPAPAPKITSAARGTSSSRRASTACSHQPYTGLPQVIKPDGLYQSQQRFGLYRWHIADPIRFEEDLRVTIQALGWRSESALSADAGRHRIDGVLVPDRTARAISRFAGPERAGGDIEITDNSIIAFSDGVGVKNIWRIYRFIWLIFFMPLYLTGLGL